MQKILYVYFNKNRKIDKRREITLFNRLNRFFEAADILKQGSPKLVQELKTRDASRQLIKFYSLGKIISSQVQRWEEISQSKIWE